MIILPWQTGADPRAVPGTEWIHGLTALSAWQFGYFLPRPAPDRAK